MLRTNLWSRLRPALALVLALIGGPLAVAALSGAAEAVPAFSRETGQSCAACHVGSMGPQLTPFGRQFKLTGYSDKKGDGFVVPLSVMADGSFTRTGKDQRPAPSGFSANDNTRLDEVSLFFAGKIYDHLGAFGQVSWANESGVHRWAWDNLDVRYGREVTLAGVQSIVGVTVNNSPTTSDIYNTTPAWGYPFQRSAIAPSTNATTLLEDGLGQRVIGAAAYGLFGDLVYVEAGGYVPLGGPQQNALGVKINDGQQLDGFAPYWRVALQHETPKYAAEIGTFGLVSNVFPGNQRGDGTDRYTDIGLDASYQWFPSKSHTLSVNAAAIFETRRLNATNALDGSERTRGDLRSYHVNASYFYDQTYGVTLGAFATRGSRDAGLYGESSAKNSPNSDGYIIEADWAPFGKKDSVLGLWGNARVALQYTGYTQFNGDQKNYDGQGHNARDNNTLSLLLRTAF